MSGVRGYILPRLQTAWAETLKKFRKFLKSAQKKGSGLRNRNRGQINAGETGRKGNIMKKDKKDIAPIDRIPVTGEQFSGRIDAAHMRNFRGSENDFRNIEVSGTTVENKDISQAEFNYARLSGVCFRGVKLENAEFQFAELCDVTFSGCCLKYAHFDFGAMRNVKFIRCQLDSGTFDFTSGNAVFTECTLENAEFHHTDLEIVLTGCSAGGIEINYCPAVRIDAENCDFHRGEFTDGLLRGTAKKCVFTDADFSGSDGREMDFPESGLRDADTRSATGISVRNGGDDDDDDLDFDFK